MNASIIQSMISAIDKPAIYISPDYAIQAVNQAYRDTYPDEVIVGHSKCYWISHRNQKPCDQCGEACPMAQCKETGMPVSVVHIHHTSEGKSYCDILMKPVKDENDKIIGFLEILDKLSFASAESEAKKMIGVSAPFRSMLNTVNRAAQSDISVLLQGETGSGKELVASALHQSSKRKDKPLVVIECTGLNESLFESELFGYEKGAFTGATTSKKGLIDAANGGTVFFDEIGDVPLNMQVKLLRLLETQSYRPVGGLKPKTSDFRLVCATHKNLLSMVEKGEFRQDLYYRIAGFPIYLPSLRERAEDIPALCAHVLRYSEHGHKSFSDEAQQILNHYTFPGNIRELKNIVEQAALLANDDVIYPQDLPAYITQSGSGSTSDNDTIRTLEDAEADYLRDICDSYPGTPDSLARQLGVSTRTLYRKLQRYQIKLSADLR